MAKSDHDVDPVEELARYFTGWLVADYSMQSAVGGMMKKRAAEYFETRTTLGIVGYVSELEARLAIRKTLGLPRVST